uniref:HMG box domain-containing protein n=1 Tax=Romanomermis culicivorax TaxID=13658 RepID=A0A915IFF0_ROMCU
MAEWLLQYSWDRRPPRKIRTAYSYFIRDHYRKTRQRLGTRSPRDIFRALGQIWRNMGPEERSAYRAQELDDRRRYADAYTHWVRYYPENYADHFSSMMSQRKRFLKAWEAAEDRPISALKHNYFLIKLTRKINFRPERITAIFPKTTDGNVQWNGTETSVRFSYVPSERGNYSWPQRAKNSAARTLFCGFQKLWPASHPQPEKNLSGRNPQQRCGLVRLMDPQ